MLIIYLAVKYRNENMKIVNDGRANKAHTVHNMTTQNNLCVSSAACHLLYCSLAVRLHGSVMVKLTLFQLHVICCIALWLSGCTARLWLS